MKKFTLFFISIIIIYPSFCQTWTTYTTSTTSTTLCNDEIHAIIIDSQDFKWFGTQDGISKFNGSTWTTFINSNSGLCNDLIYSFAIDGQGNLWVGTNEGVSKFDGTNWISYKTSNSGLVNNVIKAIGVDSQGNKWFGTINGVSKFDGTTWTTYTTGNSGLVNNQINAIYIDNNDRKFFGTQNGISKLDNSIWTTFNTSNSGLVNDVVKSISGDSQGNRWFGTFGGISKLNGTNWTSYTRTTSGLVSDTIWSIAVDAQNNKWFGTNNGVSKYNGTSWITYNTSNSGLSNKIINAVGIDSQGNKWFGTNYCISKFDNTTWTVYAPNGLCDNRINSISVDAQGNAWIGTPDGLSKFTGSIWSIYNTTNSNILNNNITAVDNDSQGNTWMGTYGNGINKYDGSTWTNYIPTNWGAGNKNIYSLSIDVNDYKWFGNPYGLCYLKPNNSLGSFTSGGADVTCIGFENGDTVQWFGANAAAQPHLTNHIGYVMSNNITYYNTSNSGLINNFVKGIAIDLQNNRWFGTYGGVSLCDGSYNDWTSYTTTNSGLVSDTVYAVGIDLVGNKWFGTNIGVSQFSNGTWTTYTTTNSGLCNNRIKCITVDSQGNIWFGTNDGISKYSPPTTIAIIQQPQDTTVCLNATASFSVVATGAPTITYQWYHNNSAISGATQSTYSIPSVQQAHAGSYFCALTNPYGTVHSDTVQLNIDNITITTQPVDTTVCIAGTATFTVVASSISQMTYQWYHSGTLIPNATSPTFQIMPVALTDAGAYNCQLTNACGTVQSFTANLSVLEVTPPQIFGETTVPENSIKTYSVNPTGGSTYLFSVINGAILNTYPSSIVVQWGTTGWGQVQCVETTSLGCISNPYILNVSIGNVGTSEYHKPNIIVYPNPTSGTVVITSDVRMQKIEIIDAFGKIVRSFSSEATSTQLDLSVIKTGIFIIKVMTDNGMTVYPIIVK